MCTACKCAGGCPANVLLPKRSLHALELRCTGLKRDDSTQTIPAVWGAPPAAVSPAASAACSCTPLWSCPQVATPCLQHIQQHRCVPHRMHQQRHCSKQQLTADHTMQQGAHAHSTPLIAFSVRGQYMHVHADSSAAKARRCNGKECSSTTPSPTCPPWRTSPPTRIWHP